MRGCVGAVLSSGTLWFLFGIPAAARERAWHLRKLVCRRCELCAAVVRLGAERCTPVTRAERCWCSGSPKSKCTAAGCCSIVCSGQCKASGRAIRFLLSYSLSDCPSFDRAPAIAVMLLDAVFGRHCKLSSSQAPTSCHVPMTPIGQGRRGTKCPTTAESAGSKRQARSRP